MANNDVLVVHISTLEARGLWITFEYIMAIRVTFDKLKTYDYNYY